jgi:hypothetical protein
LSQLHPAGFWHPLPKYVQPITYPWNKTDSMIEIFIYLAALGPGVYSASNRDEYQKHKNNNVSGE